MSSKEKLEHAITYAMANRPTVGGFPFLAECLRMAGVKHNIWSLPAVQSIYMMDTGDSIVQQGTPLLTGIAEVPPFNQEALVAALRADQAGESTFQEFLEAAWNAGVWGYDVHFEKREVMYMGARGEFYTEAYPSVEVSGLTF